MENNFDIENIERTKIYDVPNDFYKGVQENVLRETSLGIKDSVPKHSAIKPYLKMAIAASFLLIFGLILMWFPHENKTDETPITTSKHQAVSNLPESSVTEQKKEIQILTEFNEEQESILANSESEVQNSSDIVLPTEINRLEKIETPQQLVQCDLPKHTTVTEEQASNLIDTETISLDDISQEELAELTQNMDNDIYLELYN